MLYHTIALAAGYLLDLLIGDPRWLYHPVCLIGNLITLLEKGIRKIFPKTEKGELFGGFLEVILVCLISLGVPCAVFYLRCTGICLWQGLYWKPSGVISFLLQNP